MSDQKTRILSVVVVVRVVMIGMMLWIEEGHVHWPPAAVETCAFHCAPRLPLPIEGAKLESAAT